MPIPKIDPLEERVERLQELLSLVQRVPAQWAEEAAVARAKATKIQPMRCESYQKMLSAWCRALQMRQELADVLTVMIAVCLSTQQEGSSQLFLQVIGPPGSAKSTLCDALLVSDNCYALDHLTGFHSGSVDSSGEDFSLISRVNGKTLVTSEGDVVMSSPLFKEIMAQQRRIFDGSSGAVYKNRKVDLKYSGLRTPWIIAGTPAIIERDQSQLGDRFIKVRIDQAQKADERMIIRKAIQNSMESVVRTSNCEPDTQMSPEKAEAYRLTGGYINYLRENAAKLLGGVDQPYHLIDRYTDFGEFTAYLRTGHQVGNRWQAPQESEETKELPTRLGEQFARLGACVAAVLQKSVVDDEVIRIVRKVSLDTCRVKMRRLVGQLYDSGSVEGSFSGVLARHNNVKDEHMHDTLRFLKKIEVVEDFGGNHIEANFRWRLTSRLRELWETVHASASDGASGRETTWMP